MHWRCTSTDSLQEIAARFAREAFDPPRTVDMGTWNDIPLKGGTSALFRLKGYVMVWEIRGFPPGRWDIYSKFTARLTQAERLRTKEEFKAV